MNKSSDYDIKVEIHKHLMSHWCIKNVKHEFMAENINKWDPHPINIVNTETIMKNYTTIAFGTRGP